MTFSDGRTVQAFDAILPASDLDTRYAGGGGRAAWQQNSKLESKGFGSIADLSVAMADDIGFGARVAAVAAAMTVAPAAAPKLKTLVAQAGGVIGEWGETLETTRELTPGTAECQQEISRDRGERQLSPQFD